MYPRRQHGFALVSAIFLVVVLAALGGFIATVSTTQHVGSALDVVGARAFQAARSGTEWGLFQANAAAPGVCSPAGISTNIGAVDGMTVSVLCTTIVSGSAAPGEVGLGTIYTITATACNVPTACPGAATEPNYVERRLTVTAEFN